MGAIVAVAVVVAPTAMDVLVRLTVMPVTNMGAVTVMVAVPVLPEPSEAVAVIVEFPAAFAVITPVDASTVALLVSLLDQVTL